MKLFSAAKNDFARLVTSAREKHLAIFLQLRRKSQPVTRRYRQFIPLAINILSFVALLIASLYGAIHASYQISNNSDYLILPYLFKHFRTHDLLLAVDHSNLFLFPLYILQSLSPYNYLTLTLVNVGLILATIFWWVYLLIRIFGQKYFAIICAVTACIVFGSHALMYSLAGDTIRNIEYPLSLAFILLVNDVLEGKHYTRRQLVWSFLILIFFAAAIAGDSLLLLGIVLPVLLVLFLYWLQNRQLGSTTWRGVAVVVVTVIAASIIKKGAILTGFIGGFYSAPHFQAHIIAASQLSLSVTATLKQLMMIFNADIFGLIHLSPSLAIVFVNFVIFSAIVLGGMLVIKRVNIALRQGAKITDDANFTILVIALSFIAVPMAYVMLGQAVRVASDGSLQATGTLRYLSLTPFLGVAIVVFLLRHYYGQRQAFLTLIPVALIAVMLISTGHVRVEQNINATQAASNMHTTVEEVVAAAKKNDVPLVLSGYWYAAPVRFYSQGSINTVSVGNCGEKAWPPVVTRLSWYTPSPYVHRSALLIDTTGDDRISGACPELRPSFVLGRPHKVVELDGVDASVPSRPITRNGLQLWIYNYDIRTRISTSDLKKLIN